MHIGLHLNLGAAHDYGGSSCAVELVAIRPDQFEDVQQDDEVGMLTRRFDHTENETASEKRGLVFQYFIVEKRKHKRIGLFEKSLSGQLGSKHVEFVAIFKDTNARISIQQQTFAVHQSGRTECVKLNLEIVASAIIIFSK